MIDEYGGSDCSVELLRIPAHSLLNLLRNVGLLQ